MIVSTKQKQLFDALRFAMRTQRAIPEDVHEIDYLCSFIVKGLAEVPQLRRKLVLKGANALRKCFFPESRRSKDLDYSTLSQLSPLVLSESMQEACVRINSTLRLSGAGAVTCSPHSFTAPPPVPLGSFDFQCLLPWRTEPTRIAVEVSLDEKVIAHPLARKLIHSFQEPLKGLITVYSLEEMVAEKLRALLQWTRQRIEKNRTSMPVSRTYYDLWWLLTRRQPRLMLNGFDRLLASKCAVRQVFFQDEASFFNPALTELAKTNWNSQLAGLVSPLPSVDQLMTQTQRAIALLIARTRSRP
jgi:predicted nucleotidyltransferase component of viral defense system